MASPPPLLQKKDALAVTPTPGRSRSPMSLRRPKLPNGGHSPSDEAIWKRLKEAGFDEEMIKRRDKAALVAYISKLESELFDYQHHMGLLILESKEWTTKYEQIKASADLAEINNKRAQAANLSALAEAKKREENLKKSLSIEKECTASVEKALHEVRAEHAETKVSVEDKLAEALKSMSEAQKKYDEAENKMRIAESLHADASRIDRSASRKLQDVEAREDEIRRRLNLSKSEWSSKEKDICLERQSITDTQKILQQEQEKLLERQSFLNQREDFVCQRAQELERLEKELNATKSNLAKELTSLNLEKSNLASDQAALACREENIRKMEAQADQRERELLIHQESLASKEHDEIQRLRSENESALEKMKSEFETELAHYRILVEDELSTAKLAIEQREADIREMEEEIKARENAVELWSKSLSEKEADVAQKMRILTEKESYVSSAEKKLEDEISRMQKEREKNKKMEVDMEGLKKSFEDEKKQLLLTREKLELTASERNELVILEKRLKEEIDSFRAKKDELDTEVDKLRAEKEKFESAWEMVDEKKAELQKEAERIAEEKESVCQFLKNEQDSLKLEKEKMRNQFKNDFELLSREREEFITKMEHEHSEWFNKIQQERDAFVEDIKVQKKEVEICVEKRREEVEIYLRDREEAFEKHKAQELQKISSQKEILEKELRHIESERKRLANERMEIAHDRNSRDKEWHEIKTAIEDLNIQREKLQEQRKLLQADREGICAKIHHLRELEDANFASANKDISVNTHHQIVKQRSAPIKKSSGKKETLIHVNEVHNKAGTFGNGHVSGDSLPRKASTGSLPHTPENSSWLRRCADMILRRSPEKYIVANGNNTKDVEGESPMIQKRNSDSIDNGANDTAVGRKRLNDSSYACSDLHLEATQLSQKRRRQDKVGKKCEMETVSQMVESVEMRHIEDVSDMLSSQKNLDATGVHQDKGDNEIEDPKISEEYKQIAGEEEEVKTSQVGRSGLYSENLESSGSPCHVLQSSCSSELAKMEQNMPDMSHSKAQEKLSESAAGLVGCSIQRFVEPVGFDNDGNEAYVEDEIEMSVKEKIWNFIIT